MDPKKLRKFCEQECELRKTPDAKEALFYQKTGQQIKALVVVHVFGNLADMESIMEIAEEFHLRVVEDATEALGSKYTSGRYAGKFAGTIGDFGAYSFNGNKIITTGGGGAMTASNPQELEHLHYLSTQAKDDALFYVHNEVGYNYRMTNLQAALGVAQLEELPQFIENKTRNYESYKEKLSGFCGGEILEFRPDTRPNYWFYSLVLSDEALHRVKDVRSLVTALQQSGIQTRPIWGLIHEQRPYQNATAYEIETAVYYSERVINLPCSTQLTAEEIDEVIAKLEELLG
jgi:perosamine synthetase